MELIESFSMGFPSIVAFHPFVFAEVLTEWISNGPHDNNVIIIIEREPI